MSNVVNHPTADWKPDWQVQAQENIGKAFLAYAERDESIIYWLIAGGGEAMSTPEGRESFTENVLLAVHPDHRAQLTDEIMEDIWFWGASYAMHKHPKTQKLFKAATLKAMVNMGVGLVKTDAMGNAQPLAPKQAIDQANREIEEWAQDRRD